MEPGTVGITFTPDWSGFPPHLRRALGLDELQPAATDEVRVNVYQLLTPDLREEIAAVERQCCEGEVQP